MRWFTPAAFFAVACLIVWMSVGKPDTVEVGDPRIAPLWQAAHSFDRTRYGFSPLPSSGMVRWDHSKKDREDIHIDGKSSRSINFRRTPTGYRWVAEQEAFYGPRLMKTGDGDQPEEIIIDYELEPISGYPLNQLSIRYRGPEPANFDRALSLDEAQVLLAKWGYGATPPRLRAAPTSR